MKTFKEFCEQAYNPFSKTPKAQPNVVQQFMNRIGTVSYTHLTLPTNREV